MHSLLTYIETELSCLSTYSQPAAFVTHSGVIQKHKPIFQLYENMTKCN